MNRINGLGLFFTSLLAVSIALPIYAVESASAQTEKTEQASTPEASVQVAAEPKTEQNQAAEPKKEETATQSTPATKPATESPLSWLTETFVGIANGIKGLTAVLKNQAAGLKNGAKNLLVQNAIPEAKSLTDEAKEVMAEAKDAVAEAKAAAQEVRGTLASVKQLFANGLASMKLDGLMKDESVQALKKHMPAIIGIGILGAALLGGAYIFKGELQSLFGPFVEWLKKQAPAASAEAK